MAVCSPVFGLVRVDRDAVTVAGQGVTVPVDDDSTRFDVETGTGGGVRDVGPERVDTGVGDGGTLGDRL